MGVDVRSPPCRTLAFWLAAVVEALGKLHWRVELERSLRRATSARCDGLGISREQERGVHSQEAPTLMVRLGFLLVLPASFVVISAAGATRQWFRRRLQRCRWSSGRQEFREFQRKPRLASLVLVSAFLPGPHLGTDIGCGVTKPKMWLPVLSDSPGALGLKKMLRI